MIERPLTAWERFQALTPAQRVAMMSDMTPQQEQAWWTDWATYARPEQVLPKSRPWFYWLYLAGRGAGKTRTGAETCREWVRQGYRRLGLIAPTAADARDVMVEGESGLLAACSSSDKDYSGREMGKPLYEPSKRRVTWANGAMATLYSADEPERLRGPQHDKMWADELCAWRRQETWDLALFGLRLGDNPQIFVSTTPKPQKLIMDLVKDEHCHVTRGSTYSNMANLSPAFLRVIKEKYEGTRLGEQELMGLILEEAEGALWTREMLETTRLGEIPGNLWFKKIVVAVDPATTNKEDSDATGIVVVGLGADGDGYVLADNTGHYSPAGWAERVDSTFKLWQADEVVAEGNQGGDMVKHVLHSVNPNLPVKIVHASRSKRARAEPVAALFEKKKAHLIGHHRELEDQLCNWEPLAGDESPDRLDAMVWGFYRLIIGNQEAEIRKLRGMH